MKPITDPEVIKTIREKSTRVVEQRTADLRWYYTLKPVNILEANSPLRQTYLLQQRIEFKGYRNDRLLGVFEQWLDVPVVVDPILQSALEASNAEKLREQLEAGQSEAQAAVTLNAPREAGGET